MRVSVLVHKPFRLQGPLAAPPHVLHSRHIKIVGRACALFHEADKEGHLTWTGPTGKLQEVIEALSNASL